jgi:hypothetical protein
LELKPNFTKPSFKYFETLMAGILLGEPKKTVTAAVKLARLEKKFSNVHRFVSRYRWDSGQLGMGVLKLIIKTLDLSKHQSLTFALDSTLLAKFGSKIFGCAYHFNSAQKRNTTRYVWGHYWLVMGLLHFSETFKKWLCLPFLAQLFVSQKALSKGATYKSTIDLACDMVQMLKGKIKQKVILVADGYFAKQKLLRTCAQTGVTLISRLQSNAALYQAPKSLRGPKPRGRPRKYGKKLASLKMIAKKSKGFTELTLKLYGKERCVKVKRFEALWKPAGQSIDVLIVFYEKAKKPTFFFCTDPSLSTEAILTRVAARWSIESLFKDLKEHLGWSDWQCRVEKAVSRSATLTCSAASLLTIWSLQQASSRQPELWDVVPWYTNKSIPSFQDMLEQLRCQTLDTTFLAIQRSGQTMQKKEAQYRQLMRLAA